MRRFAKQDELRLQKAIFVDLDSNQIKPFSERALELKHAELDSELFYKLETDGRRRSHKDLKLGDEGSNEPDHDSMF